MAYLVKNSDSAPPAAPRPPVDPNLPRACVIGAGSSGIAAAKHLAMAGIGFDWFEMGTAVGGNWVIDNPNGQSACYESLEINTSCPRMAYSDFPMPAHYPAYAKHRQVADYFNAYVDHFALRDSITFDTKVVAVTRNRGGGWQVVVDGPSGREAHDYDAVLVANGHHWDPRWPSPAYPGEFDGEQIHSHDYRDPSILAGRDVVVVGMGNSAMDIAVDAAEVARSSTISVRRGQWVLRKTIAGKAVDQLTLPGWAPWGVRKVAQGIVSRISGDMHRLGIVKPDHRRGESHPVQSDRFQDRLAAGEITPRPGIDHFAGDRVVFTDGSESPCDLVVWATGYHVTFPFLDPELVSAPGNDLPLWKRVAHPDLPGLFFIGLLQPVGAVMPLSEAQGRWIAELLRGRLALPSPASMRHQSEREDRRQKGRFYASSRHTMEVDFDTYLHELESERRRARARADAGAPLFAAAPTLDTAGSGR